VAAAESPGDVKGARGNDVGQRGLRPRRDCAQKSADAAKLRVGAALAPLKNQCTLGGLGLRGAST